MALSQMQVFNEYIMPATIETLAQKVDAFNAASRGAIMLTTEGFSGDFFQESFFANLSAAQRRVDRYAANNAQAATNLTELKTSAVKVAGGFGPILFEPSQLTWLTRPTAQGVEVASRYFAEAMMADQLNTVVASLAAALANQVDARVDVSGVASPGGQMNYVAINSGHALFGDHSGDLVCHVVNGATYHKLIAQNLTNATRLFQAGNVQIVDILGRTVVVTDAPALYVAGSPNKLHALALSAGAAMVSGGSDVIANIATTNGKERIETTMQVDYTFSVRLKGYTWDEANGGKSPTDAEIATGTNWDRVASSVKHTAGVIVTADAAQ